MKEYKTICIWDVNARVEITINDMVAKGWDFVQAYVLPHRYSTAETILIFCRDKK